MAAIPATISLVAGAVDLLWSSLSEEMSDDRVDVECAAAGRERHSEPVGAQVSDPTFPKAH